MFIFQTFPVKLFSLNILTQIKNSILSKHYLILLYVVYKNKFEIVLYFSYIQ